MAIEVKQYKNTGLEYIQGTGKVLFRQGGVLVLLQDFLEWDKKDIVLAQVLGLANKPGYSGYDFDHTSRTGHLQLKKDSKETKPEVRPAPVPAAPPPLQNTIIAIAGKDELDSVEKELTYDKEKIQAVLKEIVSEEVSGGSDTPHDLRHDVAPDLERHRLEAATPIESDLVRTHAVGILPGLLGWLKKAVPRKKEQKEKSKTAVKSIHSSTLLMLVVIVVVGLGSMVMSAYHIITHMFSGGRPEWVSQITGVIMTLFSAIGFTAARHFWMEKTWSKRMIAALFAVFNVVVIAFAMYSTMTVNYDQFQTGTENKIVVKVEQSAEVKAVAAKESFATSELARLDAEIAAKTKEAANWKYLWQIEVNKGDKGNPDLKYQYAVNLKRANDKIAADQDERKPYATAKLNIGADAAAAEDKAVKAVNDTTIFGMLANLFGLKADLVKFIVYVIPAIFYDLMCPFALTVGMMLYDERVQEKREEI